MLLALSQHNDGSPSRAVGRGPPDASNANPPLPKPAGERLLAWSRFADQPQIGDNGIDIGIG